MLPLRKSKKVDTLIWVQECTLRDLLTAIGWFSTKPREFTKISLKPSLYQWSFFSSQVCISLLQRLSSVLSKSLADSALLHISAIRVRLIFSESLLHCSRPLQILHSSSFALLWLCKYCQENEGEINPHF